MNVLPSNVASILEPGPLPCGTVTVSVFEATTGESAGGGCAFEEVDAFGGALVCS